MCDLSTSVEKQGIEQGIEQGFKQGFEQGEQKLLALHQWLTENGRMQEAADVLKNDNNDLRTRLYAEFFLAKKQKALS